MRAAASHAPCPSVRSYRTLATEHEALMQKHLHLLQIVETEKTVARQLRQQIEDGEVEIERLKAEVTQAPRPAPPAPAPCRSGDTRQARGPPPSRSYAGLQISSQRCWRMGEAGSQIWAQTPPLHPRTATGATPQPLCASASPGLFILNPQGHEDWARCLWARSQHTDQAVPIISLRLGGHRVPGVSLAWGLFAQLQAVPLSAWQDGSSLGPRWAGVAGPSL